MTGAGGQGTAVSGPGRASPEDSVWAFGPPETEITVRNAELLLAHLPVFLAGWPFRRLGGAGQEAAEIDVARRRDGPIAVTLYGPGGNEALFDDAFAAADGLAGALIARLVVRRPDMICFHAGSARVGPGLVVLLGDSLAGKSSVALQMAAAGYRLFGDDRLAVRLAEGRPPAGTCLGLTPKVRLPLPPDCGERFAEYVDAFTEMRDDEAAYLKLWEGEAAGFGEDAPLAALVILDRRETGPCALTPASRSEIVRALLLNCFSPHIDAQALVPAMTALATRIGGHRLQFSSSREAASALAAAVRPHPAQRRNG
jgi:hypothetical protein